MLAKLTSWFPKNLILSSSYFGHSTKICLIDALHSQTVHTGCGSSVNIKPWVNLVCPKRNLVNLISSKRVLKPEKSFLPMEESTEKSLLFTLVFQSCLHFLLLHF